MIAETQSKTKPPEDKRELVYLTEEEEARIGHRIAKGEQRIGRGKPRGISALGLATYKGRHIG